MIEGIMVIISIAAWSACLVCIGYRYGWAKGTEEGVATGYGKRLEHEVISHWLAIKHAPCAGCKSKGE